MVNNGANIEDENDQGSQPIHTAAFSGNLEVIKYLIKNGVELEIRNKMNHTPLMIAAEQENYEVVKYLVGHGAQIDAKDEDGRTSLHSSLYNDDGMDLLLKLM